MKRLPDSENTTFAYISYCLYHGLLSLIPMALRTQAEYSEIPYPKRRPRSGELSPEDQQIIAEWCGALMDGNRIEGKHVVTDAVLLAFLEAEYGCEQFGDAALKAPVTRGISAEPSLAVSTGPGMCVSEEEIRFYEDRSVGLVGGGEYKNQINPTHVRVLAEHMVRLSKFLDGDTDNPPSILQAIRNRLTNLFR